MIIFSSFFFFIEGSLHNGEAVQIFALPMLYFTSRSKKSYDYAMFQK